MDNAHNKYKSIFLLAMFFISFAILFLNVLNSVNENLILSYFLTSIIFLIVLGTIIFVVRRTKFDIFELIYWSLGYFLLIFGINAIYIFIYGSPFLGYPPFDSRTLLAFNLSLFYVIMSLIVFLIGYYSKFGVSLGNTLPPLPKTWNKGKAKIIIPIFSILGLFFHYVLIKRLGGFYYFLLHKQEITTSGIQGNYYVAWGASLLVYAFFVAYFFWLKSRVFSILTWGILFPVNFILALLSGSKGSLLGMVFPMLIMFHYLKKGIHVKHMILFLACGAALFPIFNIYRGDFANVTELLLHGRERISTIGENIETLVPEILHRFTGIDNLTLIIRDTPDIMGYQCGKTMAPILVAWVPRRLWKGKPIISFGKVFSVKYHGFRGPVISAPAEAPTIIGEGYVNFHLAGLLFVAFITGALSRLVYYYCIHKNRGDSSIFAYTFLLTTLLRIWEWNISGWVTGFLPTVFTIFVICFLLKANKV